MTFNLATVGGGVVSFGSYDFQSMNLLNSAALETVCLRDKKRIPLLPSGHDASTSLITRVGKLYCATGYHLQIHRNGVINGTYRDDSRFGVLEFISVAFGLVSMRGYESGKYLCMNKKGQLYGSAHHSLDCVFMEQVLANYFNSYASCAHSKLKKQWYVAISRRGKPRNGRRTGSRKKFAQFLVLSMRDAKLLARGGAYDRLSETGYRRELASRSKTIAQSSLTANKRKRWKNPLHSWQLNHTAVTTAEPTQKVKHKKPPN